MSRQRRRQLRGQLRPAASASFPPYVGSACTSRRKAMEESPTTLCHHSDALREAAECRGSLVKLWRKEEKDQKDQNKSCKKRCVPPLPKILHADLDCDARANLAMEVFNRLVQPEFHRWQTARGLECLDYVDTVDQDVGGGRRDLWHRYLYRPTSQAQDVCSTWETAYQGSWWYSLWLVAASGVVLASEDKELGHDFNSVCGVFCSPSLKVAEKYARPGKPFPDGLYHRLVYELWVQPGKRRKRRHGSTGSQWILQPDHVRLKAVRIKIDAPPEQHVEGWSKWKPSLEARPKDAAEQGPVDISDLPKIEAFQEPPPPGSVKRTSSGAGAAPILIPKQKAMPKPKPKPRPRAPKQKAMPKKRVVSESKPWAKQKARPKPKPERRDPDPDVSVSVASIRWPIRSRVPEPAEPPRSLGVPEPAEPPRRGLSRPRPPSVPEPAEPPRAGRSLKPEWKPQNWQGWRAVPRSWWQFDNGWKR